MTAVEYLVSCITKLEWDLLEKKIDCEEYGRIYRQNIEQAKEMEKQNMHKCASFWRGKENEIEIQIFEQYYNETYGSKGSDDIKGIGSKDINGNEMIFDQELFNYFSQEFNISLLGTEIQDIIDIVKRHISSQTEISDEEIEKFASDFYDNNGADDFIIMGAKWYREQLKLRE